MRPAAIVEVTVVNADTWYELNWNMADWFLKQEERWTFSESLFLLRQWSNYLLTEDVVTGRDRQGTAFTDGIFVLYGDPALEGRVEKTREPALRETLDVQETGDKSKDNDIVRMTYKVKVNFVGAGNKRTAEKNDGWRIFCYQLPYQVTDVKVETTDFAKVVLPGGDNRVGRRQGPEGRRRAERHVHREAGAGLTGVASRGRI